MPEKPSPRGGRLSRQTEPVGGEANSTTYTALKGVGRAMEILEAIAEQPMRAKDLAEALELKWTTAYRTLAYLEEHDYLQRAPSSGQYSVGPRLYMLGSAYLVTHPLAPLAPPHLKVASEKMACAAQVNEREGHRVMTIVAVDSPRPIRKTSPGVAYALGVAAKGRLLLPHAPDDVQQVVLSEPLPAFTRFTITDPDTLRVELERIRADGYAVTREDLQLGVGSVAAPIRDRQSSVVGCVSLVVSSDRMEDRRFVAELVAAAQDAAHEISVALGWRPAATAA